jgi:hypothetical protein
MKKKKWGTLLVVQLAQALRCKPEGSGIDSRWCHWYFFIDVKIPGVARAFNMTTRNIFWGVKVAGG